MLREHRVDHLAHGVEEQRSGISVTTALAVAQLQFVVALQVARNNDDVES